ncbi:MAG: hypothetical protein QXZ44_03295 [Ferroplasma sp.]
MEYCNLDKSDIYNVILKWAKKWIREINGYRKRCKVDGEAMNKEWPLLEKLKGEVL